MSSPSQPYNVESLNPFFQPRSVAVVGASRERAAIGHRIIESLQGGGFRGSIIPVNPHAAEIAGLRAFPSVQAIADPVDLAVIAVPAHLVLAVIDDCAAKRVPAVILITAGFAETGEAGAMLEGHLRERARRYGIRVIGPNCFGVMNLNHSIRLNATYTPVVPPAGHVSIASESGGVGTAVIMASRRMNLGISNYVSVGNHADVTINDLLEYWEQDPNTHVVLLYLETIVDPVRFRRIAERVGRRKPIIALKAGCTGAGQSAAGSHTAALATNDTAVEALFAHCGVIRAATLDEWLGLAVGFSNQQLPVGRRIGIVTNSGGPGVLCADSCAAEGLSLPALPEPTQSALASFLPSMAIVRNPVDVIGLVTEEQHARAVQTLLQSDGLDALIIVHMSISVTDNSPVAAGIIRGIRAAREAGFKTPAYVCWMAEGDPDRTFTVDGEAIPTYRYPEIPARIISRALSYETWRQRLLGTVPDYADADIPKAAAICAKALSDRGSGWLTTEETHALLEAMKVTLVPGGIATSVEDAVQLARRVGYPVAVKLASHTILHKTEIGAVRLNLADEQAVREAFSTIRARLAQTGHLKAMGGVLVQPMLSAGVEVMIGMTSDPLFGPLIAFGLGGIHVEILGDVQFRIAPLTDRDAAEMIRAIKGYQLLTGYRGRPSVDLKAMEELLLRISHLTEAIPEITELDLNPIFALPESQGCRIVDARIRIDPLRRPT